MPMRIVYVDDDADIRTIVKFALEDEEDIELSLCGSGQEALDCIDALRPDLILLDVMMPGMDGPTTLRQLRQRAAFANVPVAFVTAKVQPHEIEQFKAMGAVDVIAKPFDAMILAGQVRALWNRSRS